MCSLLFSNGVVYICIHLDTFMTKDFDHKYMVYTGTYDTYSFHLEVDSFD